MEMTSGIMMFFAGLSGCAVCLILFPVLGIVFRRQRKKLIEKLETEI